MKTLYQRANESTNDMTGGIPLPLREGLGEGAIHNNHDRFCCAPPSLALPTGGREYHRTLVAGQFIGSLVLFCGIAVACLCASVAVAAETPNASLFFTPSEARQIEALAAKTPHSHADKGDVHLGAVFYYGPQDWVLWLQGERWTPATERAGLRIVDVSEDEVRLSLAASTGQPLREVTLKPYQTYQLSTGAVVEGSLAATPVVSR